MPLKVRFMHRQDIPQVTEIDHDAFPTEWPPTNFPRELENKLAYYIIAYENKDTYPEKSPVPAGKETNPGLINRIRRIFSHSQAPVEDPPEEISILGYAGMWIMADEAHVTSIASHKGHRHEGVGEVLLIKPDRIGNDQTRANCHNWKPVCLTWLPKTCTTNSVLTNWECERHII